MTRALIIILFAFGSAAADLDFNRDIRPILNKRCTSCHGGVKRKGGFSFLYRTETTKPAKSGATPVVPGKSAESEMLHRIHSRDPDEKMPPKGDRVPAAESAMLAAWIDAGAPFAEHWAYVRPERHAAPKNDWARNDIDRFIAQRLQGEGLKPAAEAPAHTLLRRLHLDLIGLPPSGEDVDRFLADSATDAYEREIDRLLRTPQFGERWAGTWLDLARYADTQGYEKDNGRSIFPFRDWVIKAFNDDMPFDQFTIKQLAGDLLPKATQADQVATGFHRNTMCNTEGGTDDEEYRVAAVIDRVNTTWEVWMGTSFGCVQCHNHPYDPFLQTEYYQFFDFLNQTEDADKNNDAPTIQLKVAESATTKIIAWQYPKVAEANGVAIQGDGSLLAAGENPANASYRIELTPEPGKLGAVRLETLPNKSFKNGGAGRAYDGNFVLSQIRAELLLPDSPAVPLSFASATADHSQGKFNVSSAIKAKANRITGWAIAPKYGEAHWAVFALKEPVIIPGGARIVITLVHDFKMPQFSLGHFRLSLSERAPVSTKAPTSATTLVMRDLAAEKRRKTHLFRGGNWTSHGEEVSAGTPSSLPEMAAEAPRNRLGLARWIVSKENPLTARVAVNRFWEQIFGQGIVSTVEDFGTQGAVPTHPALLDDMAVRFVEDHKWRVKSLLKEMLMSATYRQSSHVTPELLARDPQNQLLARGPRYRLSAEQIRDQALAVSGLLSDKMYGPSVMPPQPDGIWKVVYSGKQWKNATGADRYRRGLYTYWRRTSPYPAMETFDAPSREFCVTRRIRTNTPLQALVTLNDPAFVETARALGKRLATAEDGIVQGFKLTLARLPTSAERERLQALFQGEFTHYQAHPAEAEALADSKGRSAELAAWTAVANVLLNLDETLTRE